MELNENLKNNLIKLRKDRTVTQEVLAAALDISVQAVSKWETGTSMPDIMQLPRIAKFYGVTIDYLFYNEGNEKNIVNEELPNDNVIRIIQFYGNKMLRADQWEKDKMIDLKIPEIVTSKLPEIVLNLEIWGSANIHGDIGGYVESGNGVNCGDIQGNIECGGTVNCGDVGGNLECGGEINCGDVEGHIECSGGVNCGNISDYVECGGTLSCGNINGNAECAGDIRCNTINGQVECDGNINCKEIKGDIECSGNITYEK